LEAAFQRVDVDEMIELMWDDEDDIREVSKEYSSTLNYHATSPLRVPAIRQRGLLPSARGAGSDAPALYTSPLRFTCMRSYNYESFFPTLGKSILVMFGVTGTKMGSFRNRAHNWQTWYAPGNYEVRTIQFLVVQVVAEGLQLAPVFDDQKHPGKARREWERKVRVIEENHHIRNAGISKPIKGGGWERVPVRKIRDFPKRKRQKRFRGSIKVAMVKFKRKRRRERQQMRLARARLEA
jgi:hypothetical protein